MYMYMYSRVQNKVSITVPLHDHFQERCKNGIAMVITVPCNSPFRFADSSVCHVDHALHALQTSRATETRSLPPSLPPRHCEPQRHAPSLPPCPPDIVSHRDTLRPPDIMSHMSHRDMLPFSPQTTQATVTMARDVWGAGKGGSVSVALNVWGPLDSC